MGAKYASEIAELTKHNSRLSDENELLNRIKNGVSDSQLLAEFSREN